MYIFFVLIFPQFLNYIIYMIYIIKIGKISIYRRIKFYNVKKIHNLFSHLLKYRLKKIINISNVDIVVVNLI